MEYSSYVRQKIKQDSKRKVSLRMGTLLLANVMAKLMAMLLSLILLAIIYKPIVQPLTKLMASLNIPADWATNEAAMEWLMPYANEIMELFLGSLQQNWIFCVLIIVLAVLLTAPLTYSMQRIYMDIARGHKVSLVRVFDAFASFSAYWRALRMQLVVFLKTLLLWVVPVGIYLFVGFWLQNLNLMATLGNLLALLSFFIVARTSVYKMGWICSMDDKSLSARAAVKQATTVMQGQYGNMLVFVLSFILWYLVKDLVLSVGASAMLLGAYGGLLLAVVMFFLIFFQSYQEVCFVSLYDFMAKSDAPEGAAPDAGKTTTTI